jgi:hypothetical protein
MRAHIGQQAQFSGINCFGVGEGIDRIGTAREGAARIGHHQGVVTRPVAEGQPRPTRRRWVVSRKDDVVGAQPGRPAIERRRRDQLGASFTEKGFELVHLGQGLQNYEIIPIKREASTREAGRYVDQQDVRQCWQRSMIVDLLGCELVDKAHARD